MTYEEKMKAAYEKWDEGLSRLPPSKLKPPAAAVTALLSFADDDTPW